MKILLAVRTLNIGGTERQVVALAKALTAENCEVHIAVVLPGGELELDLIGDERINLHHLAGSGISRLFHLRKLVKRERYDAVYGFLPNMNLLLLGVRMMRHRPLIAWGVRSSGLVLSEYPRSVRIAYRLEKIMSRFADAIITNSLAAETEYKSRGYRARRIVSVPNAINTNRFAPNPSAKQSISGELQISSDSAIIGIFARIHPTKDHLTFLAAAQLLLQKRPDTHFLIVGEMSAEPGSYGQQLKALSNSTSHPSNIHWLGQRLDPESLMVACDLTTLTSTAEGFPNAIAESMACGTPVVSTNVGDAAKIIGNTGKIVKVGDPEALARAWEEMLELSTDELNSLGEKARSSIIERYSPVNIAQITLQALSTR